MTWWRSAGGVEALKALVAGLPPDFPGALLVVLHVPHDAPSALPAILDRAGPLPARHAVDGEELRPGRVYVAPADRHLLVIGGRIRLSHGPSENGHRPAIDPLFRSAARAYGRRVVAVVLSGSRDDGAAGLQTVAAHGGLTVVQDPADALFPSMPAAALARATPDHVLPAAKIGGLLTGITAMSLPDPTPADDRPDPQLDLEVAMSDLADVTTADLPVAPAGYGCPSCGGSLHELGHEPLPRFRCRVGHAWSPESLLDEQAVATEGALWMALRALEEKAALSRRMADGHSGGHVSDRYDRSAREAEKAGRLIRRLIDELGSPPVEEPGPAPAEQR
ncbi:chemotaxis protein CheB [Spirilliplanes yamanashiensis]|uniref:protein-glutamate methylesterase n=1 Tax=Spirilliplanes yamanashiensis TaxID=42233 RepID=A0A8J3Y7S6_9ACTN|nr:chemotaxis protein CheB [Spirilliplanes yamanashiensis]MDP9817504.1 two-component system chemotaxis response regulator CheB [Spirilliplanes yamanashiensis]GIJ02843.1 chemotaxis protein CheB [Spirilliplanes yamanashiensis]